MAIKVVRSPLYIIRKNYSGYTTYEKNNIHVASIVLEGRFTWVNDSDIRGNNRHNKYFKRFVVLKNKLPDVFPFPIGSFVNNKNINKLRKRLCKLNNEG